MAAYIHARNSEANSPEAPNSEGDSPREGNSAREFLKGIPQNATSPFEALPRTYPRWSARRGWSAQSSVTARRGGGGSSSGQIEVTTSKLTPKCLQVMAERPLSGGSKGQHVQTQKSILTSPCFRGTQSDRGIALGLMSLLGTHVIV